MGRTSPPSAWARRWVGWWLGRAWRGVVGGRLRLVGPAAVLPCAAADPPTTLLPLPALIYWPAAELWEERQGGQECKVTAPDASLRNDFSPSP